MPALFTRMSICPNVSTAWAMMRPAPSKSDDGVAVSDGLAAGFFDEL